MRFLITLIVQELCRPLRRKVVGPDPAPAYSAWDARDGLAQPAEPGPDGLPTPLQVLELAFPAYPSPVHEHYTVNALGYRRPLGALEWCHGCARDAIAEQAMSPAYRRGGVFDPWQS